MKTYYVYQDAPTGFWYCKRDASGAFGPGAVLCIGTVYQDQEHAERAAIADNGGPVHFVHTAPPAERRHVTLRKMAGWDK